MLCKRHDDKKVSIIFCKLDTQFYNVYNTRIGPIWIFMKVKPKIESGKSVDLIWIYLLLYQVKTGQFYSQMIN